MTIEKTELTKQFSLRLRQAMIAKGHNSPRSPSGVSIEKLAQITDYSLQICRRYLRGEAIPDPTKLIDIAQKLNVQPGWLLFGDTYQPKDPNHLSLSKDVLHYLFSQAQPLYAMDKCGKYSKETADFLLALINQICRINGNDEQSKEIVDIAMTSIKYTTYYERQADDTYAQINPRE